MTGAREETESQDLWVPRALLGRWGFQVGKLLVDATYNNNLDIPYKSVFRELESR